MVGQFYCPQNIKGTAPRDSMRGLKMYKKNVCEIIVLSYVV
jgi:hypothetical protein